MIHKINLSIPHRFTNTRTVLNQAFIRLAEGLNGEGVPSIYDDEAMSLTMILEEDGESMADRYSLELNLNEKKQVVQ